MSPYIFPVFDLGCRHRRIGIPDRARDLGPVLRAASTPTRKLVAPEIASAIPEKVPRHSLAARLFHWIMAAAMLVLLVTAFLPKVGVQFAWVTYHWIAGIVLTVSILFHIIHATFWQDFWSIWPDSVDMEDAKRRWLRATGKSAPAPRKFAKYPLENKIYHLIIVLAGLAVIITGVFMMKRVRTPFFTRNPYLFSDMTWGLMYVLHGLAGVGLIALDYGAHLFRAPAGEAGDYEIDGLRLARPRPLSGAPRSRAVGPRICKICQCSTKWRIAVTPSKNVMSLCWPMPGKGSPAKMAAKGMDRFVIS